jgi:hypothetical protein
MKHALVIIFTTCLCVVWFSLKAGSRTDTLGTAEYVHRAVKQVTDVIVYDIYSPPVASRIYAYACIAGYEAAVQNDPEYISFAGQLQQLKPCLVPIRIPR